MKSMAKEAGGIRVNKLSNNGIKMKNFSLLALLLIILTVQLVPASYIKGNPFSSIKDSYPLDSRISGWINLSITDEPIDSLFMGNFGGNATLKELLDLNLINYSCNPSDCNADYTASSGSGALTKEYNLNSQEKIISFKLDGNFRGIADNGIKIKIQGTNSDSCSNPLKIDILDDGIVEFTASNYSKDFSCAYENSGYGCFSASGSVSETEIEETPYCNKVRLVEGSAFELGAFVKKDAGAAAYEEGLLNMELYDEGGDFIDSCSLPEINSSNSGREFRCRINYTNNKISYHYSCLSSTEPSSGYKTKYETNNACGFFDTPPSENYAADYQLYARGAKYGNTGIINIDEESYSESGNSGAGTLAQYITDYIETKYDSDCSGGSGCVIPIRIKTDSSINVKLLEASVKYRTSVGVLETKTIYDSEKTPAKISLPKYSKLNLDKAGFLVSKAYGNVTFVFSYKGTELLSKKIEVKRIPLITSVKPMTLAAYQKTLFTATIANTPSIWNNYSITYSWDFGDETTSSKVETQTNTASHTYEDIGDYTLKLAITDSKGNTHSKEFEINVQNPKDAINKTLADYKKNLNKINVQLSQIPSWQSGFIKQRISLNNSEKEISELEKAYIKAINDNDEDSFLDIMASLSELYIPSEIKASSKSTGIPLDVSDDGIIVSSLEEVSGQNYPDSDETAGAILAWADENVNVLIDYQTISGYGEGVDDLVTAYKIRIIPLSQDAEPLYLIINEGDLSFASNYSPYYGDGFYGISLNGLSSGTEKSIEFLTSSTSLMEEPDSLRIFVAPSPSKLDLEDLGNNNIEPCNFNLACEPELDEDYSNCPSDCRNNTRTIIYIVAVLIVAVIIYILMMWWYRNSYGSHLFKNKKDFDNIMLYITKSSGAGMSEDKIKENLKKAGWKGEQIDYAMKKYGEEK